MKEPIRIEPLTPSRLADFLAFFDHERRAAFADNPEWAKCYCHFYHVPKAIAWDSFDAQANRIAMTARIAVAEMEGFLAYCGADVVGWLNAQPLHKLPHCWARMGVAQPTLDVPLFDAAAIVCFDIAPDQRRHGVARALLDGALGALTARGLRRVYAFPFLGSDNEPSARPPEGGLAPAGRDGAQRQGCTSEPSAHYHGPRTLFDAAGFAPVIANEILTLMCKVLPAAT